MMTLTLRHKNFIAGSWCDNGGGAVMAIFNPADLTHLLHEYPKATPADVAAAIESAKIAQRRWAQVPLGEKVVILRRAVDVIMEHRDQIATVITAENGKLLSESQTEIDSTILELNYQVGEGERRFGDAADGYGRSLFTYERKEPLGVVSVILPWNFPFNVPFRKLIPALMAGNAAIVKPAGQTPAVGELVVQILIEAGIPAEVIQFVTGSGAQLSDALVGHPNIRAVTFTGSTEVGRQIAQRAAARFTRTQLEMGGKNPMVVLGDADLELAAADAAKAAFSCAGQWCTATSRLIVTADIADDIVGRIALRAQGLRVGRGDDSSSTMGPVCGEKQLLDICGHIDRARAEEGTQFVTGGNRIMTAGLENGCFVEPTIIDHVLPGMKIATTEVFGPVLSILRVPAYEDALALANDVPYGLSSSIYTRDLERALHFVEHSEVGLTHVNVHSAYKEPHLSFSGIKESGFGLPEAGSSGIQFFQESKAIYIRKGEL